MSVCHKYDLMEAMGNDFQDKNQSVQPLVSIIIPTKNSSKTLLPTLESIMKQTYKKYEIIVVDNYSTDGTVELARRYTDYVYVEAPERTAQVNFGIRKAKGKYIYEVGSDFVLDSDVIEEAVKKCENEGYDALAIHNTSDASVSFWASVRKFERDMYQYDDLNVAARFIRRDIFDKIGYFDESMVAAEDYDLHNRIIAANYRVGRISAKETHIGEPKTLGDIIRKHYYYGKTLPAFIAKNPKKGIQQLSPFRPAYTKNWTLFFKHPTLAIGFFIYQMVRYPSAILGYIVAKR